MPKKAAMYIRVSTMYQIDKDSLPLQRQELINYAKYALNISDYEIFEDAGYSGKNTDRPAYQDMMKRVRNGEFSHIMVWKIDRISRNLIDFATMYDELKKLGIVFISKNEQFDTSSAMGEAMLKIILVFAELERNMTSERVTAVMLSRAEKGLWNGANVPLGYEWSEKKQFPVVNNLEAVTIHLIFDMYEDIESTNKITLYLNRNNIPTKRGGSWTSKTVSDILRNCFYKGTLRYNYRHSPHGKKKKESEWIIKDNNHEALISVEQWQHCNNILDRNAALKNNTGAQRRQKHVHIFSSLLRCKCGGGTIADLDRPRITGWRPSKYRCTNYNRGYKCDNNKVLTDVLLGSFVFSYIKNILLIQSNLNSFTNLSKIEKQLLSGDVFKEVIGIEEDSLKDFYYMLHNYSTVDYEFTKNKSYDNNNEKDALLQQREKNNRALERLKRLFLFDDNPISEKEYIIEKKQLIEANIEIDKKISLLLKPSQNDSSFLIDASKFVFLKKLYAPAPLNYRNLAENTETIILKKFVQSIIEEIHFEYRKITSIKFKNGLEHKFIYK